MAKIKPIKTFILAGGFGTRLRRVLSDRPKPMALVADRPFLEYLILQLRQYGLTDIVLCIGYQGEQVQHYFSDGRRLGVHITYSHESEPLDTGGAIKLAESRIQEQNVLVMNGDSFFDVDLHRLIDYHTARGALATIALAEVKDIARYGAVAIDNAGGIKCFAEKESGSQLKQINGGIYLLRKDVFDAIPEGRVSLEKKVFPTLIGKGFYGMPNPGFFIDIGVPNDYQWLQEHAQILLSILEERGKIQQC